MKPKFKRGDRAWPSWKHKPPEFFLVILGIETSISGEPYYRYEYWKQDMAGTWYMKHENTMSTFTVDTGYELRINGVEAIMKLLGEDK